VTIVLGVLLTLLTIVPAVAAPAAPGFRVTLLDSRRSFDSREMMGKKVVVLRFQASYCKPCVRESQALARLVERYRGREVEFLALHVQDTAADVRRFVREQKVNYAVALDPKLTIGNRYGLKGTPYTVVIDRKGEIAARLTGESAVTRLPRLLDEALRQGAPKT
jgi:thiol-disulfide isomerase/thioredoxin